MTTGLMQANRRLTGWHVLAIFVGGFSIIIAVNLALAVNAVRTFPGKETESSYIASQNFQADRAAQEALGWAVETDLTPTDLRLAVQAEGRIVRPEIVSATLGRATTVADDIAPAFAWDGTAWVAPVTAGPGNWNLRIEMRAADGTLFRRRIPLRVTP
ncbi:fixH protein, putative [Pseudooceanicola batsensis HTCC2597]|uniref:FixH protein, putative n=1 Tax=Pseudooceanicola batsensis (strain ATCC BAA-863 / DSM 15984 / KCTC 12145 / HTCC2597) TaxID=252305 RepID=A3U179_PSEBH|nr:FixH family protein [Pseudooceanicola batsensis]EAQ02062.1 fixH protein, putative [Pseudooceanicola batsensis HTCC2597]